MKSSATVSPPVARARFAFGSRRDFLRTAAVGGAALAIPSLLTGCKIGETTLGSSAGPTGPLLTIDFATGDTAFIKFLSVYKQVQADLYARMVAGLATSDLTTTEQAVVTEIKNHEIIHRDTIAGILGTANAVTVTPKWGTTNFKKASEIMTSAINFEDVSVGLYNGMLQHFISSANIQFALEIQSVEARHAAALRDEVVPKNGGPTGFSPGSSDGAYALSGVAAVLQPLVTETLQFTNAPAGL
jgi:hypothetical protein